MPNIPAKVSLTRSAADILNLIRNNASPNYRALVPAARLDDASAREIGAVIMQYPDIQNEFIKSLANRIGLVIIQSKMYENPWRMFKRGLLEYGETVEEIFVNIARPFQYDPEVAEREVFKREIPDVRTAFHPMNFQKFYKVTVQEADLRLAFLSWGGVSDLIGKIIDSMYSAASYDEFITMKYLIARHALDGHIYAKQITTVTAANMKAIASTIKGISNALTFMTPEYNLAGVPNSTPKEDQYLIMTSDFDATMDVEVLAAAFNIDKAEFSGKTVLVDSFGTFDAARMVELYGASFTPFTDAEVAALNTIPAVLVSADWFMIFDEMVRMTDNYNGQGIYWNYFLHFWKTFSVSPFNPAVLFVPGAPAVDSISVSPSTATVNAGQSVLLSAEVTTDNFASKAVNWTLTGVLAFPTILVNGGGSAVTSGATSVPFDGAEVAINALAGRKVTFGSATTDVYTITANTDSALTITPALAANVADNATINVADSVSGADVPATIDVYGLLTVNSDCPAGSTITATATAVADTTKTASAVITTA